MRCCMLYSGCCAGLCTVAESHGINWGLLLVSLIGWEIGKERYGRVCMYTMSKMRWEGCVHEDKCCGIMVMWWIAGCVS